MRSTQFRGNDMIVASQWPSGGAGSEEIKSQWVAAMAASLESAIEPDVPPKSAFLSANSAISEEARARLLVDAWLVVLDGLLSNGRLSEDDQRRLLRFAKAFELGEEAFNGDGAVATLAKAATLADVMHGSVPDRGPMASHLRLNLLPNERVVWVFPRTRYLEDRTRRLYVEGSSGLGVHVAKGTYYHANSFKGHPVDHADRAHLDTGACVATSRNLHFVGPSKSLRIPYAGIMSFYPFSDGVGVMQDAPAAKLQAFATGNGWFTYNLLTNLARF